MNRLCDLPRGFGGFSSLEVLDLTYNNLRDSSFPGNWKFLGCEYQSEQVSCCILLLTYTVSLSVDLCGKCLPVCLHIIPQAPPPPPRSPTHAATLRALYMGDNDLTKFPPDVQVFKKLTVVS